jgi:hypothetical protein
MSTATAIPPPAAPGLRTYATVIAVLHLGLLLGDSLRTDESLTIDHPWTYVAYKADELLRLSLTVPVFALTLHAIGRLRGTRAWRLGGVALLSIGCVLLATALMMSLPYPPLAIRLGSSASMEAMFGYMLWANLVVMVLAVLAISHLQTRRRAVERLAEAQDQGRAARQKLALAQLQAIQARVDPQLLFDTLGAVKRFYQHEAGRAEGLLDELATFLRAALPRPRGTRSSLEFEFHLVASYTRLQQIAFDRPVRCTLDLRAAVASEAFPAGLLLPLASGLIEAHPEPTIDLAAAAGEHDLQVSVRAKAPPETAAWERLTAALGDLYGGRARARWWRDAARAGEANVIVEVEVPRDPS